MGLYGGGVNVLTAPHPLGPWRNVSASIDPGCPMWKQSTCFEMGPGEVCDPVTQAQQNYVITVPLASGGEWEGGVSGSGGGFRSLWSASLASPSRSRFHIDPPASPSPPPSLPHPSAPSHHHLIPPQRQRTCGRATSGSNHPTATTTSSRRHGSRSGLRATPCSHCSTWIPSPWISKSRPADSSSGTEYGWGCDLPLECFTMTNELSESCKY